MNKERTEILAAQEAAETTMFLAPFDLDTDLRAITSEVNNYAMSALNLSIPVWPASSRVSDVADYEEKLERKKRRATAALDLDGAPASGFDESLKSPWGMVPPPPAYSPNTLKSIKTEIPAVGKDDREGSMDKSLDVSRGTVKEVDTPGDDLGPSDEMREDESKMKELLNQTVEKANNLGKLVEDTTQSVGPIPVVQESPLRSHGRSLLA